MLQNPSVFRLCNFINASKPAGGPELHSQCSDLLQAEQLGVQTWCRQDFTHHPEQPWGPPSLLYSAYCILHGSEVAGAWC